MIPLSDTFPIEEGIVKRDTNVLGRTPVFFVTRVPIRTLFEYLEGIIEQASENQAKAQRIIDLNARMRREVAKITRLRFSDLAVNFIFSFPIFSTSHFVSRTGLPRKTAFRMLQALRSEEKRVLRTIHKGGGSRPAVYVFSELVNIAEGKQLL